MDRIESALDVKPGDVLVVEVTLTDRTTGRDFTWKRYACVLKSIGRVTIEILTLKLHPEKKDYRAVNLRSDDERCYLMPEHKWPAGVVAMRMKLIAQGKIKLSGDA